MAALAADPDHGAILAGVAGCAACHTADGGAPYAGGYALDTEFGTFRGTNLTPDPDTGLGRWSYDDFERAMRRGRSPDGDRYWPVFPYPSFTRLADADLQDLWAFLQQLPPVSAPEPAQEPDHSGLALRAWRTIVFRRASWTPLPDPVLDRGAYLVEVVGHCDGCHSERTRIGRERPRDHLAGSDQPPHPGPNLTPGRLRWTEDQLASFLEDGMTPDGDFAGGGMRHVIRDGTSRLSDEDRRAMARYLLSLPPRPSPAGSSAAADPDRR